VTRAQVVCAVGLAAVMAGMCLAGHHHDTRAPKPTPTATADSYWQQQLADAAVALEANSTALQAAPLDGQPIDRLTRQWCNAVKAHNVADQHLGGHDQINTKDCPR
jgi:alkylation response protein AidB-like acyl-CoA dehydrogenase